MCGRFNGGPNAYPLSPDLPKLRGNIDHVFSGIDTDYIDSFIVKICMLMI